MDVGSSDGGFDTVVFASGTKLSSRSKSLGRATPERLDYCTNQMNVPVEFDSGAGERD
ncbi:hypothetical protein [Brevibacterium sp. UCMA 11752]|uniref:hypothetical protein n=1 Tax=Brevibacterium sp. UCMA 11752 TaxID=2745946 RepID=UPI001F163969|nr:hypothetical protein [Brevibacterium sp. UCMA 11752]MCF2586144.1 hypothetical protein [Brevibacterium sp. UCMA 11752]